MPWAASASAGDTHDSTNAPLYTAIPSPKRRRAARTGGGQLVDDPFARDPDEQRREGDRGEQDHTAEQGDRGLISAVAEIRQQRC